jgi:hypothetical protein
VRSFEPIEKPSKSSANSAARITLLGISAHDVDLRSVLAAPQAVPLQLVEHAARPRRACGRTGSSLEVGEPHASRTRRTPRTRARSRRGSDRRSTRMRPRKPIIGFSSRLEPRRPAGWAYSLVLKSEKRTITAEGRRPRLSAPPPRLAGQ